MLIIFYNLSHSSLHKRFFDIFFTQHSEVLAVSSTTTFIEPKLIVLNNPIISYGFSYSFRSGTHYVVLNISDKLTPEIESFINSLLNEGHTVVLCLNYYFRQFNDDSTTLKVYNGQEYYDMVFDKGYYIHQQSSGSEKSTIDSYGLGTNIYLWSNTFSNNRLTNSLLKDFDKMFNKELLFRTEFCNLNPDVSIYKLSSPNCYFDKSMASTYPSKIKKLHFIKNGKMKLYKNKSEFIRQLDSVLYSGIPLSNRILRENELLF